MDNIANEQAVKKRVGPRTFNESDLCVKPEGINALYSQMVINRDKMNLKGKGHEVSDFSKLIQGYKNWHMQFAPKLKFEFATSKINSYSGKKNVVEHVGKLRQIYINQNQGEQFEELFGKTVEEVKETTNLFTSNNNANSFNIETAKAQQAEKEKEAANEYFEMAEDEPVQIDTMGNKPKAPTDEQMRIWEQNRLAALQKKRLREL